MYTFSNSVCVYMCLILKWKGSENKVLSKYCNSWQTRRATFQNTTSSVPIEEGSIWALAPSHTLLNTGRWLRLMAHRRTSSAALFEYLTLYLTICKERNFYYWRIAPLTLSPPIVHALCTSSTNEYHWQNFVYIYTWSNWRLLFWS